MDQQAPLPSFKQQLAIVYDEYMSTLGGGERSALAFALALSRLDFTVEIVSMSPVPSQERIVRAFGAEFQNVAIRQIQAKSLYRYLEAATPMVFVNHTFMDFKPNPGRIGIYAQMFPVSRIGSKTHPREVAALSTYQLMLSNSYFTKNYADSLWDFPLDRSHVLHPPIGQRHTDRIAELLVHPPQKSRQFVNVGRFNPGTHNKNQKIVIECFLEAKRRFAELKGWNLVLVGNSNANAESIQYLEDCEHLAAASDGSVTLRKDLAEDDLVKVLRESFGYVHATGAFSLPGETPYRCEHFGLSIIEAMANACIPLVYARGGVFDVLEPGSMGVPYVTREGLIEGFREIAGNYGHTSAMDMQRANLRAAKTVDFTGFTHKLAGYIATELNR